MMDPNTIERARAWLEDIESERRKLGVDGQDPSVPIVKSLLAVVKRLPVRQVTVCKLPYQDDFFVHGVSEAGGDVWLTASGEWSSVDGDPACSLPGNQYLQTVCASAAAEEARKANG